MARFSNPAQRFYIWDLGSDNYNHTQLAANLDAVDAVIGVSGSGSWPTTGQSLYSYITTLQSLVEPVGTLRMFLPATSTVPIPGGLGGVPDSHGWCICDGSSVTGGNHSFKDTNGNAIATAITLPDFRNRGVLGANTALAFGQASVPGDGAANAPGAFGLQGTNASKTVNQTLPDHYHEHVHIHEVGNVVGGAFETGDASAPGNGVATAATGGGQPVSAPSHHHHLDIYSSEPRLPDNANYRVAGAPNNNSSTGLFHTSTQAIKSGGTVDNPSGGNPGDPLAVAASVDLRNASIGVIYLMKVKQVIVA